MKWEMIPLGELIEIKKGAYITKKEAISGPYPVILGGQEPAYYINKYNHLGKAIVVSRSGASAGFVSYWNEPIFVTDGFVVEPKENVDFDYLYFLMKSFQPRLQGLQGGAAIPHITPRIINALEVSLPPSYIQHRIADILSSYDDLIENNQKQIKLLEEAAQRLYKEWFVNLRFPGHEKTPIVDGVPEGWKKASVGELCKVRKEIVLATDIPQGTPYIGLEHMPRKDFCLSSWGDSSMINSNKYLFHAGNIIFGQIRPYFHKVGFTVNDGVASTDSFIMEPIKEHWALFLLTVSSEAFVNYVAQTCKEGAKMPRADWRQMEKYPLFIADEKTQKQFEAMIKNITSKIKTLVFQKRNLREARDRLLPKLMSGEIEV